jgi:hypothetical protein
MLWRNCVFEWHRWFDERWENVQDDPRSAQPENAKGRWKCGQSINLGVLKSKIRCETKSRRRLWASVQRKRLELWPHYLILHHDSALVHDVLRVSKFLAKKSITKLNHPPYSPDLAPKLKKSLKVQRLSDISDIQCNMMILLGIPENNF